MTTEEIVAVMELAKHEHYTDGHEGLMACDALSGGTCDCGADGINAKIDRAIESLRQYQSPVIRVDMIDGEKYAVTIKDGFEHYIPLVQHANQA